MMYSLTSYKYSPETFGKLESVTPKISMDHGRRQKETAFVFNLAVVPAPGDAVVATAFTTGSDETPEVGLRTKRPVVAPPQSACSSTRARAP